MVVSYFHSFFVAVGEDALASMFMPNVCALVIPFHDCIASFDGVSWLAEVRDVFLKVVSQAPNSKRAQQASTLIQMSQITNERQMFETRNVCSCRVSFRVCAI